MEILSSRILLHLVNLDRSRRFHRDVWGLAVYREFWPTADPAVVFFLRIIRFAAASDSQDREAGGAGC